MKAFIASVAIACAACTVLVAQGEGNENGGGDALRYDFIGTVGEDTTVYLSSWSVSDAKNMTWLLYLDATHRFMYMDHELTLVHKTAVSGSSFENTIYEAYLLLRPNEILDVYAGKKRMNIGTGMTFTPGDSYNPVSWFFDQKTGSRDLIVNLSPSSILGMSLGISLERCFENLPAPVFYPGLFTYGLEADIILDRLELFASLVYCPERTFNPGIGFSLDVFGIILSCEGAVELDSQTWYVKGATYGQNDPFTNPRFSGTAGARYEAVTEDINLLFSVEYIYAGQSWTKEETDAWKSYNPLLMLLYSPKVFRNQHNLALKTIFSGWSKLGINGTAIINCTDASVLLNASVSYSPYESVDLVASLLAGFGPSDSEWGSLPNLPVAPRPVAAVAFTARFHI